MRELGVGEHGAWLTTMLLPVFVRARVRVVCAVLASGLLLVAGPSALSGQSRTARSVWPQVASGVVAVNASVGAAIAIQGDLRQEPFGIRTGRTARDDFFFGTGTALSPGLSVSRHASDLHGPCLRQ